MKYRVLGRTGASVSEIGMGTEHLLDKDEQTVTATIRSAVTGGVTYFDCHPGHDLDHESIAYEGYAKLGRAIEASGGRDGLRLTHLAPVSLPPSEIRPRFEEYLRAMKLGFVDVFILQFCDKPAEYASITADGGLLDYAFKLRGEGLIKHIGISTHSAAVAFDSIGSGAFDMLMYPVNPAFDVLTDGDGYVTDELETLWNAAHDFAASGKAGAQPRKSVYIECHRKGVGLVAMKPFAGGFIFGVEEAAGFTPVNLISYALAQNGVSSVVPGCTCPREIEEILTYNDASPEARDYGGAVAKSRWSVMGNCLYCNHCLPCGAKINIAEVNRLLDAYAWSNDASVREAYGALAVKASACVKCGACIERCPFGVNAAERMDMIAEIFERR